MKNKKQSPIVPLVTVFALTLSLCSGILITDLTAKAAKPTNASAKTKSPTFSRYARDLSKLAERGKLDIANGQLAAVRPLIQILSRDHQNNPVLIGEEGSTSMAVVEGLAQRITMGRVPANLRQSHLYSLNIYALLDGVKTTAELEGRVNAVLAEVPKSENSILFVDELYQFIGKHAAQSVSDVLTEAAIAGKVRLIGASSRGAYDEYIASDAMLAGLFGQVNLEDFNASQTSDEDADNNGGFEGEKISADLRELTQSSGSDKGRVNVILQVDDVKSGELNDFFKRYGVEVNTRMAQLGTLKIDVPVKALEELAARNDVRHLSADREVRAFGHVSNTTGADAVRQQTTALSQSYTLDGSGIGIAILDSGIDIDHKSFLAVNNSVRVVFSKDFTGENRIDDAYGHGTHVAATAASNGRVAK